MTREEFKQLDIIDKITFINNELKIHKTITTVCKEHDLRRQTISDDFKKNGYILDKELCQYTKVYLENSNSRGVERIDKLSINTTNTNTREDKYEALEWQIRSLEEHINSIYKLLEAKECTEVNQSIQTNVIHNDIEKLQEGDTVARTFKLYNDVDKRLQEYIRANKQYKIQDIVNSIFIEYLDRYNK